MKKNNGVTKLTEIDLDEISFVDNGANKRKFLFRKAQKLYTHSLIACKCGHSESLVDFAKSASEDCPECGANLLSSKTKIITKNNKGVYLMKKLIKKFKEFIGEDETISQESLKRLEKSKGSIKKKAGETLSDSIDILIDYADDFPEEVKDSISKVLEVAIKGSIEIEEDEDKEINKAGRKLSKKSAATIKKAVSLMKEMSLIRKELEALDPEFAKSDEDEDEENVEDSESMKKANKRMDGIEKSLKDIVKALKKGDNDEDDEDDDEDDEKNTGLAKRMTAIEKDIKKIADFSGVKKSITSQDDDEEKEIKKSDEDEPWGFEFGAE
jgi:hypothetical protein